MKRRNQEHDWDNQIRRISRERDLPHMVGPVCSCRCHRNGDEYHHECCFYQAANERRELVKAINECELISEEARRWLLARAEAL
jgi:hypothetical protein